MARPRRKLRNHRKLLRWRRRRRGRPGVKALRRHNSRRAQSSIEKIVGKWLESAGVTFQREKSISRCHVDIFLAPNTVIELNGCFWHKHHCLEPEQGWSVRAQATRMKDLRRYKFFRGRGFKVAVIWECQIKEHPGQVRRRLHRLAKKAK